MNDLVTMGIKAVNGGLFVVAFSLIGAVAIPKRFAGLFSAAPSVALANLIVVIATKGSTEAQQQTTGMIVGGVALIAATILGVALIPRIRALRASLAVCAGWLMAAGLLYPLVRP